MGGMHLRIDISNSKEDIKITTSGYYEIFGITNENNIYVNCQATIVLDNLSINVVNNFKAAIYLDKLSEVTLIIRGINELKSADNYAGIQMIGKCRLIIKGEDSSSTLNIESGTSGAGIGAGFGSDLEGNLIIESGNINILSAREGAGIGGGNGGNGGGSLLGDVTIEGGTINITTGLAGGAGIGGGSSGHLGGNVTINNGNINLQKESNGIGAGIGGGYDGDLSGNLIINNGKIISLGGEGSAGIGAGIAIERGGNLTGTVTINGGSIIATGGAYIDESGGAGIGGGYDGNLSGVIKLNGGNITAYGPGNASDIGAGSNGVVTGDVGIKILRLDINPTNIELNIGESKVISTTVVLVPEIQARILDYEKVIYTSQDTNIATVDTNGVVSGIRNGETEIIVACVADKSIYAVCKVNVNSEIMKIGEIDLLIEVEKTMLQEANLYDVLCYGNNPVIVNTCIDENIKELQTYIFFPKCNKEINVRAEYKKISVYITVNYSVILYTYEGDLSNLAVYAMEVSSLSTCLGFCVNKDEDIDLNQFNIVLEPKYEVDKDYSKKYYLFKISGNINLVRHQ